MSYFVVGVGGTGAKLMQTLIHLSAAGLLPDPRQALELLLVDPDEANGNVDECHQLERSYDFCHRLQLGATSLFNGTVTLEGPWTPTRRAEIDTLESIFQYSQRKSSQPIETDLMELLFDPTERSMRINQGFRGRPAIGAAVLSNSVNFADDQDVWHKLRERALAEAGNESAHILLAGSVFGGSGAAGVPTIFRLLQKEMAGRLSNLRLGLILFLPYFRFTQIPGEAVQADPNAFATATAEALKYYHERGFLNLCSSIYAVGEEIAAEMAVSSVGAANQRNEPHFLELVAGLGALRFLDGEDVRGREYTLSIAARLEEATVRWADLPSGLGKHDGQMNKLQQMVLFAIMYHYLFYPKTMEALSKSDKHFPFWKRHILDQKASVEDVQAGLARVDDYITRFLKWFMHISTPRRGGFTPGMVNVNAFATRFGDGWQLKLPKDFKDKDISGLFLNSPVRPDWRSIWNRAAADEVADAGTNGTGRLVRAFYDACEVRRG